MRSQWSNWRKPTGRLLPTRFCRSHFSQADTPAARKVAHGKQVLIATPTALVHQPEYLQSGSTPAPAFRYAGSAPLPL